MEIRLKIEDNMSKAEEIKILKKLQNAFEHNPNNYLTSLFHGQLVAWCGKRIKDDFPIDIYEMWESTEKILSDREAQIKEMKREFNFLQERIGALEQEISEKRGKISLLEETNKANQDATIDLLNKVRDLEAQLEQKDMQLMTLKAKIFDLLMEGGKI